MCKNNDEYIQLPPFKRGTPAEVVEWIWTFAQLSTESREKVRKYLQEMLGENLTNVQTMPETYTEIPNEEIKAFEGVVQKLIAKLVIESSQLACWVYDCKYNKGLSIEEMVAENEKGKDFIITMSALFDTYKEDEKKAEIQP